MTLGASDSKILALGGRGFLGQHLVDRLVENGHSVRVFGRVHSPVKNLVGFPPAVEVFEGSSGEGERRSISFSSQIRGGANLSGCGSRSTGIELGAPSTRWRQAARIFASSWEFRSGKLKSADARRHEPARRKFPVKGAA